MGKGEVALMVALPLGRCWLDAGVSRGVTSRGSGVQRGSPFDEEKVGDDLGSGKSDLALTKVMSQAVAAWGVSGGEGRNLYWVWEVPREQLVTLSLLLVELDRAKPNGGKPLEIRFSSKAFRISSTLKQRTSKR